MTHRIGILGAGNISQTHARAALELPNVEIAAVHGIVPEVTEAFAKEYGGTAYHSFDEFLDHPEMDVVLIGTPSGEHARQASAVAKRGIHVLSEKPLDISLDRIDSLIAECEKAGVKLGVFFQDRTAPDLAWLKEFIDSGGLGELILATASVKWYRPPDYYTGSPWRGTWALDGGGALMNQGVHTVDMLIWLFGDVARVFAQTRTALHEIEVEDTAVACLSFENGAVGTLEATTAAYPGYPRGLELTGSNGTIVVEGDKIVSADLLDDAGVQLPDSEGSTNPSAFSPTVSDVSGHKRVLEDFLHAIDTDGTPRSDGREGRRSIALISAIYESARSSEPVAVNLGK